MRILVVVTGLVLINASSNYLNGELILSKDKYVLPQPTEIEQKDTKILDLTRRNN